MSANVAVAPTPTTIVNVLPDGAFAPTPIVTKLPPALTTLEV